jgi:DNA-binding XRE family transcriptional regulator
MTKHQIKAARMFMQLSQVEMADALGLPEGGENTVAQMESGRGISGPMAAAVELLVMRYSLGFTAIAQGE